MGDHCNYSSRAPKHIDTPLVPSTRRTYNQVFKPNFVGIFCLAMITLLKTELLQTLRLLQVFSQRLNFKSQHLSASKSCILDTCTFCQRCPLDSRLE